MEIRKAVEADIPNLLPLMRQLAEFEKYADDFAVTEHVLHNRGSTVRRPIFIVSLLKKAATWLDFSFIISLRSPIERSQT